MHYGWLDLVGNLGVLLIVGAYLWLQLERISAKNVWFSAVNALGAALIIVSLLDKFNLSALLMEGFWLVISLFGLVKSWPQKAS